MKEEEIIIKKAIITGVRNPILQVTGKNFEGKNILVFCNDEELKYNLKQIDKNKFKISVLVPKKCKKVEIFSVNGKLKTLICEVDNNLLVRIKISITNILKDMFYEKRYYKNKRVGIRKVSVTGINNPLLTIEGTTEIKDYELEILSDGNIIDFDMNPTSDTKDFIITSALPARSKISSVYIKDQEFRYLILTVSNKKIKRLFRKIKYLIRAILMKFKVLFIVLYKGVKFLWREHHFLVPPVMWKKYIISFVNRMKQGGQDITYNPFIREDYEKWLGLSEERTEYEELTYRPLISILIPVYNIEGYYLSECIDSILNQTYDNFEICLADDKSTNEETIETLKYYKRLDKRVRVVFRKENGHISNATNSALEIAKGEFISLVDNDDTLDKDALYEVVKALNDNKELDFIYSDEDKLDLKGRRCDPNFKPNFSPDTLLSLNYICHLTTIRKTLVDKVGGFTVGLEGAQDYDLFLKVTELTSSIHHIPKILYHWRMVAGSTSMTINNKGYAIDKGKTAIENALKRRKIKGTVLKDEVSSYYIVNYEVKNEPLVSIIIPTRDYADVTEMCLKSIFEKTTYKNFEVILVNNNSEKEETFELFKKYTEQYKNFKVLDANIEFNYSKINNLAALESKGEYILLLNNDTEVITPNWIELMVGYASQKHIGTVGVKLLYPDTTVQHCGVLLGLGGVASHAYLFEARDSLGMYGRLRVPYNYSANTAACLMVRRELFMEVGMLDEGLKVAYNDIDFNIRVLNKGYYNITLPMVELFHHESKSRGLDTTAEKYKRFIKEEEYMFNKWSDILLNDHYYNKNFSLRGWFRLDKELGVLPERTQKYIKKD